MDPSKIEAQKSAGADVFEGDNDYGLSAATDINNVHNNPYLSNNTDEGEKIAELGPNPITKEVFMAHLGLKKNKPECESNLDVAKTIAKCQICNDEHLSENCPFKDTTIDIKTVIENKTTIAEPALIDNASKQGQGMYVKEENQESIARKRFDYLTIRISNLSELMTEAKLDELVKDIGPCKTHLAIDDNTGLCKGFGFVHFEVRDDASAAIALLNDLPHDDLTLSAEYSKPYY